MRVEENLNYEKSPNEEMSLIEINKCLKYRDDLLGKLSMQWRTWKEPEPNPEPQQHPEPEQHPRPEQNPGPEQNK